MYCPLCWETMKLPVVELPQQKPTVVELEILHMLQAVKDFGLANGSAI